MERTIQRITALNKVAVAFEEARKGRTLNEDFKSAVLIHETAIQHDATGCVPLAYVLKDPTQESESGGDGLIGRTAGPGVR